VSTFTHDLRFAVRAMSKQPGFTALAVLTLAVGIGVNAVAFSAVHSLLSKPGRFADADQLARLQVTGTTSAYHELALPDFQDVARESRAFAFLTASARVPLSFKDRAGAPADEVWGQLVSRGYFPMLRVVPEIGQLIATEDDASALTAVVSERFWNERLGGGPSVAGRTVTLNGSAFAIVGVVPDGFQGPSGLFEPDVWLPLERLDVLGLSPRLRTRDAFWLNVVGRLRPGVTHAQAQSEVDGIMANLAKTYPATHANRRARVARITDVPELRAVGRVAWVGLAIVGAVLLIACFNVAGLLLARAAERRREFGIRVALGAGRWRILRQLLTEGLLLAGVSGAMAILLASWSADLLSTFSLPSPIPQRLHIDIDGTLVAFIVALVLVAAVVPALAPAFQAARVDLLGALRREPALGGRPSRVRNTFVIAQVGGSTLFLAAALLFLQSFLNAARREPGFDAAHTLVLELNASAYGYDAARSIALYDQLVSRITALPGVNTVGLADRAPYSVGFPRTLDVSREGTCAPTPCRAAIEFDISSSHFSALGVPLRAGREFTEAEWRSGAAVAIVGESMAAALWPDADPVGGVIRAGREAQPLRIVGVAADLAYSIGSSDAHWYVYRPLRASQLAERVAVIVRTSGDPRLMTGPVRQQVQALDDNLPAAAVRTSRERMDLPLWPARTAARFFAVTGALALLLATVGLFGVTYYTVGQRTREFGVRAALGATRSKVVGLVLREGVALTAMGIVLGVIGALVAMRLVSRQLFGVDPADPAVYALTAAVQAAVALAACALPAYRATRVDPMVALRDE
jgi:predicted permease